VHVPDAPRPAKFPRPLKPLLPRESARRCQVGPDLRLAHLSVTVGRDGAPVGVDRYGLGKKSNGGRQKELSAFISAFGYGELHMGHSLPSCSFSSLCSLFVS
jgi:hypothetical protein